MIRLLSVAMFVAQLVQADYVRPHPEITPGVIRADQCRDGACGLTWTQAEICAVRWGVDRRDVTPAEKRTVFQWYRIKQTDRKNYEVDHRLPRSAGGADVVCNLWPQCWAQARVKDRLEMLTHRRVCIDGTMTLEEAQAIFLGDWRKAYVELIGPLPVDRICAPLTPSPPTNTCPTAE